MEVITIGPGPHEENVAQIGFDPEFTQKNIAECKAFKEQIVRAYGEPPEGASLRTIRNPHEFGTYREVAVRVDEFGGTQAWDYAYAVEGDVDGKLVSWDEQARVDLGLSPI
jgi:hypothetical protein